jgi:hypothetical protein
MTLLMTLLMTLPTTPLMTLPTTPPTPLRFLAKASL